MLLCLPFLGLSQTNHVVTFKVNTANITVGSNGLYLGGGVIGGANAVQLTDPDGNGVYEGTDTLSGAGGGNFIFLNSPANSGDWGTKENLAGMTCADANNWNDRILPSFTQDTTLMFCFGTCATDTVCPVQATNPDVTFSVDMNNVTASFTNVYVSGSLNSWSGNANQLTDPDGDGIYTGDISLAPGNYEFKFTYDNWTGQESLDPATQDSVCTLTTGIYTNRYITIGSSDTTLPVYCWEECSACAVQTDFAVTFMVNTANITVGANGLYLGGGVIGGANAVQLLDPDGDGIYVGTDTLNGSNGGNFIFLNSPSNNADWGTKENLAGLSCADASNYNDRILPTFTQDTTLLFCYGSCATDTVCPVQATNPDVTFSVDMNNVTASYTNVYESAS